MQGSIHVGRIAGISIDLHISWFIIFVVVVLLIGSDLLPTYVPGIAPATKWVLGVGIALLFFISLLLHELAHSLIARRLGMGISGITLFVFGGVSRLTSEPRSAADELKMAIAGPATSALLGAVFLALFAFSARVDADRGIQFGFFWLGMINLILAGFNLLPGFPMDGGRVLRAIVWSASGDLRHSTYIASTSGQVVAYLLILFGVFALFFTSAGPWGLFYIVLGWFLLDAARSSYQQQLLQSTLSGVRVRDIMTPEVVTIAEDATLQDAVDHYFLRLNYAAFPVVNGSNLRGILTLTHVRQVPREQWLTTRVGDVVEPLDESHVMRPDDDAWDALAMMAGSDRGRLLVVDGSRLAGIISRTNIMRYLRTKLELGM